LLEAAPARLHQLHKEPLGNQPLDMLVHLTHPPGGAHQPTGFDVVALGVFAEVGAGNKGLGSGGRGRRTPPWLHGDAAALSGHTARVRGIYGSAIIMTML
jgi:hypothetical protein